MKDDKIQETQTQETETKEFFDYEVEKALENCQNEGYQPFFMPQLIDGCINGTASWSHIVTPSVRATGRTNKGVKVVVYAHIPNWLANPKNIRAARSYGLINGAARIPQDELQRLVDTNEKTDAQGNRLVWVIDYDTIKKSQSGVIPIDQVLAHPHTIPFFGGESRAVHYLQEHIKVEAGSNSKICVEYVDDLNDESPLARLLESESPSTGLLLLGNKFVNNNGRLDSYYNLHSGGGYFLGIRNVVKKIEIMLTLDDLLDLTKDIVPKFAQKELEIRLNALYQE